MRVLDVLAGKTREPVGGGEREGNVENTLMSSSLSMYCIEYILMQFVFLMQDGYTPLMAAASGGSLEVVRLLVEKGAEVNTADDVRRRGEGGQ